MAKTLLTNTFTGGMNIDISEELIKNNQYRYAENVRVLTDSDSTTGVLLNIEDITKYASELPDNETVIGSTVIDKYGVIFTKSNSDTNLTKVYRVTGFDTHLTITCILKGYIGITDNILAVGNYETQNVVKVYFSDGNSMLKVLNIVDNKYISGSPYVDSNGNIKDPTSIDIVPGSNVIKPEIKSETTGNLTAGMVQYSCLLFDVHGSETNYSPLSEMFHLTSSSLSTSSANYKGTNKGENSGKGCIIRFSNIPSNFLRCRIIRLLYTSNNETPKIEVIAEINIKDKSYVDYIDAGGVVINELTQEVFNTISNNLFSPKAIAKKDNRLFVANILEDTWDVDYDARAYRSNGDGLVKLLSSTGSDIIYELGSGDDNVFYKSIPKEHDCICPYNTYDFTNYVPYNDKYIYSGEKVNGIKQLGGKGLNVRYSFTLANLTGDTASNSSNDMRMNVSSKSMSTISLTLPETGSKLKEVSITDSLIVTIPNLASPIINYKFTGYLRDEIYRFGLVFYNKRGTASPVHWIADIRFPRSDEDSNGLLKGSYYYAAFEIASGTLSMRPIGVRFLLNNIPSEVSGVEIVRCDRTENDKTILFQSAVSNVYNNTYSNAEWGDLGGRNDIRPHVMLSNANLTTITGGIAFNYGLFPEATSTFSYEESTYKTLISPEISVMLQDIEKITLRNLLFLDVQYCLASPNLSAPAYILTGANGSIYPNGTTNSNAGTFGLVSITDDKAKILMTHIGAVSFISKYYVPFINKSLSHIIEVKDIKYPKLLPYQSFDSKSSYYTAIGNKLYLNYALSSFENGNPYENPLHKNGISGPCCVTHLGDVSLSIPVDSGGMKVFGNDGLSSDAQRNMCVNAISIVNVKLKALPYGGNMYTSRLNSVYISTGSYMDISELRQNNNVTYVFGGDTYLGILDHPVTMIFQRKDANANNDLKIFVAAYIPFESSINTWLLSGDMAHSQLSKMGNYGAAYHQLLPVSMGSYYTQSDPYFVYNDAYSSLSTAAKYVPKGAYSEDNMILRNRILCSEAKTNNEITDSWTKFKYADYLDTDNAWGLITNLSTFKDKLFFWQDSALGVASVNERSLIDDGNVGGLVLGTGGILTRADYVTTTNGSSVVNDKSIVSSDNALYWYDKDKNEVCSYNGQVHQLSKEKGVLNYLNESKHSVKSSQYDSKYNEVWTSFDDKSLIFNEQLGAYTSFYTHTPEYTLLFSDSNITGIGNKLHKINKPLLSSNTALPKVCKVTTIVNKDAGQTKVFDNVSFPGEFEDSSNNNSIKKLDNLVKDIEFKTKTQTGAPMKPYYYSTADSNGLKYAYDCREDNYRFAIGRGKSKLNGLQTDDRMRGKWLESTYQFDCSSSDANIKKSFKLPYINTTYRHSLV